MKTIINGKTYPVTQTGNRFFYFSSKAGRKLPVSKKDVIFEEPKTKSKNNTNILKSKKMRNLIILAVAYAVALTESDVMELGYNVTEEDFKGYFEIPEEAQINEFKKMRISVWKKSLNL